jgi:hypothetical protein
MATFNASISAAQATGAAQSLKPQSRDLSGKIRYMLSTLTVPVGGIAIADVVSWGSIPKGARVLWGSKMYFAAGTASSTLNLGDAVTPARYLAATSVATAGSVQPEAHLANGASYVTLDTTQEIRSVVAGAALLAGQVITLHLVYVQD